MARTTLSWFLITFLGGAVAAGCGSAGGVDTPDDIDNGFESDDPTGRQASDRGASFGGDMAAPPEAGNAESDGAGDAQRVVEEADIIRVDGDRLFALSRYGGLAIVDVTNPDHMKLLGRKRTDGMPFEMYVRGDRAYVMFNDFGRWVRDASSPYGRWIQTSEIVAYDLSQPANIQELGHFDVPGNIADSRLVGDALYLVTHENGYCWGCNEKPGTIVTSFNVAGPSIAKIDQLSYTAQDKSYSAWQRSVSATNQRLYIAGPEWSWQPGQQNASSVIQVVDITDPTGHLVKGANVPVAGQINSRWQMDEHEGVLRVVSQFGNGWGGGGQINPKVQTFTVQSASTITPLGQTELILPEPESLRSVRFDGERGYAITAEQTDPLFTIDLSNPAEPKQAGELEMPGWVFHMEPRGDRLIGFGYEDTNWNSRLAVSLFDVSDLSKPTMMKRVAFGTAGGRFAEDQDRIHKSVRILDDQNLVLVPFASYGQWWDGSCTKAQSGIQLIDFNHDNLTLRGIAPQHGMPRRALTVKNRLLAVSDRNVTSFDIASRDNPVKKGEVDLSNPAYRMTELPEHVASITNDWFTGEVLLSVTPKANADDAEVSGKLSLASLAEGEQACSGYGSWASWYSARLFANGTQIYVAVPVYSYGDNKRSGKLVVASIDTSDPTKPVLSGKASLALTERDNSYGYWGGFHGFWDGHHYYSTWGGIGGALVGSGEAIVQLGTKLAYLELDHEYFEVPTAQGYGRWETKTHRKVHVVDFADPAAPAVHAPIALPESRGYSPLHLANGTVLTSRWVPSDTNKDKVRFFVDRVDITGAAPVRLPSLNTPGSLLSVDETSGRYVTVDYTAARTTAGDWQSCTGAQGYRAIFDYESKECVTITRSFKLADVAGSKVTLRDTLVPPSQNIAGVQTADDRVYVSRYTRYDYSASTSDPHGWTGYPVVEDGGLWAIGGIRDGKLAIVSEMTGDAEWPLAAKGTKVALYTTGGLAIYDTATATPTLLTEANLRGWGYSSHVLLGENRAIASLGEFGLQTIKY
jgi:hypothetical protein